MTWVLLKSGAEVSLVNPDPATFRLRDILHGLCYINRFSGAVGRYSVADHLFACFVHARDLGADVITQAAALTHDFHEAYFGDISSPAKQAIGAEVVKQAEHRVHAAVWSWLVGACEPVDLQLVTTVDLALLLAERDEMLPRNQSSWYADALVPPQARYRGSLFRNTTAFDLAGAMWSLASRGDGVVARSPWSPMVTAALQDMVLRTEAPPR
jgi:uncharacterized protein